MTGRGDDAASGPGATVPGAHPGPLRVDRALVHRGLSRSRTRAAELVRAGYVSVNGEVVTKVSHRVQPTDQVALAASSAQEYVSRAGHKLAGALDRFPQIDPRGLRCLDAGASTGGFTDVLLRRGAREVLAVDVGHDQLVPELRADPRVRVFEGLNVRHLSPEQIGGAAQLTVCDLSFISLRLVVAPLAEATVAGGTVLLMVKPQFEVGAQAIGASGVVASPRERLAAVEGVQRSAHAAGLEIVDRVESPLPGRDGNVEYFLWTRKPGANG